MPFQIASCQAVPCKNVSLLPPTKDRCWVVYPAPASPPPSPPLCQGLPFLIIPIVADSTHTPLSSAPGAGQPQALPPIIPQHTCALPEPHKPAWPPPATFLLTWCPNPYSVTSPVVPPTHQSPVPRRAGGCTKQDPQARCIGSAFATRQV